jgi:hypothetical protein
MLLSVLHNTTDQQTASSTVDPLCRRSGDPPTQLTRSEEIHVRALMLSKLGGTPKRSIALVELCHDDMLLTLSSTASHTTKHGHIGT